MRCRLAVRTNGTLSYLLGDHLGSSSLTTDANGVQTATALYKAFGETRYTLGNLGTDYKFTGQRLQAELGIYWFQSRWMDPSLGRFTQPDTIVPTSTQGTQGWDRYAFVNNNPVRYNDPTGHEITGWCGDICSGTAKFFDWVGGIAAGMEMVMVDEFAIHVISAGCLTGGVGCGIAIGVALAVDVSVASYANPIGGIENAAGWGALIATTLDDTSNGSTYLELNEEGELALGIGGNTIVSATTMALGHFPESNVDFLVSAAQLTYDYTLGEYPSTLIEFRSDPLVPPESRQFIETCIPKPGTSCSE